MNSLENHLKSLDSLLFSKFEEAKLEVEYLLDKFSVNFPEYTDHSIKHTLAVFDIAAEILSLDELKGLNADETYILSMACLLHDVGMCIPEEEIKKIPDSEELLIYRQSYPNLSNEDFIRNIHHTLSHKFILKEWEMLKIPTKKYAKAIGLVAEGHRKVDLGNFEIYDPVFFAKSGKNSVCLPYLSCILRVADELDVTNSRVPRILSKYYLPDNEISIREWTKHISTSQRNYISENVLFEVICNDQNIYAALQEQFDKIQDVINYAQKIIRSIPPIENRQYNLRLTTVKVKYEFEGFSPKGIKFSLDVQNVVNAFVGEDLYKDKLTSLREAIQNSIDSCRYKLKVLKESYNPLIKIKYADNSIIVEDNGAGMDEFIIENFFARLASSFYEQDKIKSQFEAIGQFGVGVFSYFLISEYIDIETKSKTSKALKFRFDKDTKSYFHFFDDSTRITSGTTLKMVLKEAVTKTLTFNEIEIYIRNIFRHVEIPIELTNENSSAMIEEREFVIDGEREIKEALKILNKSEEKNLKTISLKIDDDELIGICAIVIGKDYLTTFKTKTYIFEKAFLNSRHGTHSKISICQKGIFVNDYSTRISSFIIGDINLKKKVKINIDRNQFSDEKTIFLLIQKFEIGLLKGIFTDLEKKYKNEGEKLVITQNFLNNYCYYGMGMNKAYLSEEYIQLLRNHLYIEVCTLEKSEVINLNNLTNSYKDFIIINKKENLKSILELTKKPIIVSFIESSILKSIIKNIFDYNFSILCYSNKGYDHFDNDEKDATYLSDCNTVLDIINENYYMTEIIKSNSDQFFVSSFRNKPELDPDFYYDRLYINFNSFYIKFLLKNKEIISSTIEFKKIVRAAHEFLYNLSQLENEFTNKDITKVNKILTPISHLEGYRKFKSTDFKFI